MASWIFGTTELLALANLVVVATGVYVARSTFQNWQDERIATRRADLAEEVLSAIYESYDIFRQVRSPFSFAGEGETRSAATRSQETDDERRRRDSLFVPFERIEKHADYWRNVYKLRTRVRAYFGSHLLNALDEIPKVRNQIMLANRIRTDQVAELDPEVRRTPEEIKTDIERRRKQEAIIWEHSEDDEICMRLKAMISTAEGVLLPILRKSIPGSASHENGT